MVFIFTVLSMNIEIPGDMTADRASTTDLALPSDLRTTALAQPITCVTVATRRTWMYLLDDATPGEYRAAAYPIIVACGIDHSLLSLLGSKSPRRTKASLSKQSYDTASSTSFPHD
jgi:hypothetical protein